MREQICVLSGWIAGLACLSVAPVVRGETVPPFIGGPLTVLDMETTVMDSGALLDAEVVVSPRQRKYVTIDPLPANTTALALQDIQNRGMVQVGKLGFVGGVTPTGPTAAAPSTVVKTSPAEIAQADKDAISYLNRRGVFLIAPLIAPLITPRISPPITPAK